MTATLTDRSIKSEAYYLSGLTLTNFRNYKHLKLKTDSSPVVLTGENGAGKTNILEAISLLSPGKGVRKIKLSDADRLSESDKMPWSIVADISCGDEERRVGTGRVQLSDVKRIIKIDGDLIKGQAELAEIFSVMWLTPQMDGLFIGASSDRRKFLDRLVYNFDPEHASRIYSYEYTMRERAKLLQNNGDRSWLAVLENKMAERSVSIAAARIDTINAIGHAISRSNTAFPKAVIGVEGIAEELVSNNSALYSEEELRKALFDARGRDAITGRTSAGSHRSDFVVVHREKNMPAASCSTGEQKALLISIILAEARAKAMWKGKVPVLLLDEVVAHLDEYRRRSLFDELLDMKAQVWMTGTDRSMFSYLEGSAQMLNVSAGFVE